VVIMPKNHLSCYLHWVMKFIVTESRCLVKINSLLDDGFSNANRSSVKCWNVEQCNYGP
jgi:hypothetical protein